MLNLCTRRGSDRYHHRHNWKDTCAGMEFRKDRSSSTRSSNCSLAAAVFPRHWAPCEVMIRVGMSSGTFLPRFFISLAASLRSWCAPFSPISYAFGKPSNLLILITLRFAEILLFRVPASSKTVVANRALPRTGKRPNRSTQTRFRLPQ